MQKVYLERFQWPLALGLLCLVLEPLIGIRRNKRVTKPMAATRPALAASWNRMARPALSVIVILPLFLASSAHASVGQAEKAFQKGDYAKAEQEYRVAAAKNPDKPVLQFNHGAAAYKSGGFDQAAESFTRAMKTDDLTLQEDDYYNLANTQYRLGQKTEKANAQETIKTWGQSVQSYEAALQLKPADADAKYNRDLVKRKLEELKKQQQQKQSQQQQQPKNQDQKDQNKKNDQQNQQDKQDQGQPDDKKNRSDKQNGDSGQQDKQNGKDQTKPDDKKDPQNKTNSGQQAQQDQQQDKQSGGASQQDKQGQANQKPEPQDQTAQTGRKPVEPKKAGQPQPRNAQPKDDAQDQADVHPEPGQMSREEAKQLLDSLKSEDRKMPLTPATRSTDGVQNEDPVVKDW